MTNFSEPTRKLNIPAEEICSVRMKVEDFTLRYTLSSSLSNGNSITKYYISVSVEKYAVSEHCTCECPFSDHELSKNIFEAIVRGAVTPCTLEEILSDFR